MSLTPTSRREQYYDAIANGSTDVPEPISREEQYLKAIAENGGGGGETSSDITISGSIASSGDFAEKSDYLAADYEANATLENMLTKASEQGKLDIGGCISKAHDSLPDVTITWGCKCVCCFVAASQTFASLIAQLGKSDYEDGTDGILIKVGSPIAGDEDLASLIIYQSTSGVKCFTTTAL